MNRKTAVARARKGAAFLDEKLGRGWRRKIRRRRLDMGVGLIRPGVNPPDCGCILAQLSADGGWSSECDRLGLSFTNAEELGFTLSTPMTGGCWDVLGDAWLEVLREPAAAR